MPAIVAHRLMLATAVCKPHSNYYACSQRTVTQLSNYLIIPDFLYLCILPTEAMFFIEKYLFQKWLRLCLCLSLSSNVMS